MKASKRNFRSYKDFKKDERKAELSAVATYRAYKPSNKVAADRKSSLYRTYTTLLRGTYGD